MTATLSTVDTPNGPFSTVLAADGVVLASGWTAKDDELLSLISPRLRPTGLRRLDDLGSVTRAIVAYYEGDVGAAASVPVHQQSTEFRELAWDVLRKVPAGEPVSYAEYASLIGRPAAIRAAAGACAHNAAALFVPCHRVVRTDGGPGGFRWGTPVKSWLLSHEAGH